MASQVFVSQRRAVRWTASATERIMFLLAVNNLLGRMKLSTGRLPEIKSGVPITNWPMPRPLPACPNLLIMPLRSRAWFPVFVTAFVVLSMQQNLLLHLNKQTGGFLFPVVKQHVLSFYFSYITNWNFIVQKERIIRKQAKVKTNGEEATSNGNAKVADTEFAYEE
jgi:hypothetical protein